MTKSITLSFLVATYKVPPYTTEDNKAVLNNNLNKENFFFFLSFLAEDDSTITGGGGGGAFITTGGGVPLITSGVVLTTGGEVLITGGVVLITGGVFRTSGVVLTFLEFNLALDLDKARTAGPFALKMALREPVVIIMLISLHCQLDTNLCTNPKSLFFPPFDKIRSLDNNVTPST